MKIKILTTLICFLCIGLINVTAQEESPKEHKKIVIVKKTVDADGNETVEKIVKEGTDADEYIRVNSNGVEGNKEIKIKIKKDGEGAGENIWISDDNQVINLDGKKYKFKSDGNALHGDVQKKIRIVTKDGEGQEDVIEWDGEGEMPADLMERLKEKGVDVKSLDGGKGMFFIKSDGEEGDHDIHIEIDGADGLTPEMKERIHKMHKGEGKEDNDFVFKSSKINSNKAFLGVNIEDLEDGGVKVVSTIEGSAAEEAGILAGDVITYIAGTKSNSVNELIDALTPFKPGDAVNVGLTRNGNETQVKAVLKERTDIHTEHTGDHDIEVIVIGDCDSNLSGDDEIDMIFKSIGEEGNNEEIIIIKEIEIADEGGEQEIEIEVTVEGEERDEEVEVIVEVVDEEVIEGEDPVETIAIVDEIKTTSVNTERLKNLDRLKLKEFKAFPNPTDGVLNLSFQGKKGPLLLQMTDINGKPVYKNSVYDFQGQYDDQISFDGLPKGTYILYIIQEGRVYTDNIIFN